MRKLHNIAVLLYVLYSIFYIERFQYGEKLELPPTLAIVVIVLILGNLYYLFFSSGSTRLKSFASITSKDNLANFLQLCILLYAARWDLAHPAESIFYLVILILLVAYCIGALLKVLYVKSDNPWNVILGHLFLIFLFYSWSKDVYIEHYGNEIIGDFWEKTDYDTIYFAKLYKADSDKFEIVPVAVHVYSEQIDDPYDDTSWTKKYIMAKEIVSKKGRMIKFDHCDLRMGRKVYCSDQNGKEWHVELTRDKPK